MKRVFNRLDSAKNYAGTVFVLTSDGSGGTDVTNLTDELAEEKARYAVLAAAARRSRRSHLVRGQPPRGTLTRKCRQANIEPADQRRSLRLGASHGLRKLVCSRRVRKQSFRLWDRLMPTSFRCDSRRKVWTLAGDN